MNGGFANMNGGGFGNKPRALMCYICGREYGTTSLQIHLKTCMKKWEIEEMKKPKRERRPMPQPPQQLSNVLDRINGGERVDMNELESYNNKANDEYNDKALINCEYCNRTFLPERLGIHRKICTPEKPFKPLPPKGQRDSVSNSNHSASTSTTSSISKGGRSSSKKPAYQEEEEDYYPPSKPSYGSNAKSTPSKVTPKKPTTSRTMSKPGTMSGSRNPPQYQQNVEDDEEYEEEEYIPPPKKTTPQPKKQAGFQAQSGGYGQPAEYSDVNLVPCDICGRSFAADRLDRHQKACVKVQKGEAKHAKKVAVAAKKQLETEKFIAKEQKYKKSSWRDQHNDFIQSMKYNRQVQAVESQGGDIRSLGPPPKMDSMSSNFVECPYCARKFNPQAAERHINVCKNVVNKPKAVGAKSYNPGPATNYGSANTKVSYGSPNTKSVSSKVNSGLGSGNARGGSYGGYDDYNESSYAPSNYGKQVMGQSRQGFGVQSSPQKQFGSTQMNSTKGGGFGMKSPERSSLATAGKMAMQDFSYKGGPTGKSTGYRY